MRICSLLPGATEVIAALGLADQLVGISHECDFPPEVRDKPVLVRARIDAERSPSGEIDRQVRSAIENRNDLYIIDDALFSKLQPDLVITQDLCDACAITPKSLQSVLQRLPAPPRLLSLNPASLEGILTDIERIGAAVDQSAQAGDYLCTLRTRLALLQDRVAAAGRRPTVVCLEWLDPLYVAGHWVPEMIGLAGGQDLLGTAGERSRTMTWPELMAAKPDILIVAPCGFSVERTMREISMLLAHPQWARLSAVQTGQVYVLDASAYMSRPGPRLIDGVELLARIFHPALFEPTLPRGVERVRLQSTLVPEP
jgi:iron complex transport system substrate-binding protein